MHRRKLPPRRYSEVTKVHFRGMSYFIGVGYYIEGKPAEIFVSTSKMGTDVTNTADDACIMISYLLQVDISKPDVEEISSLLQRDEAGNYASIVGVLLDMVIDKMAEPLQEKTIVEQMIPERFPLATADLGVIEASIVASADNAAKVRAAMAGYTGDTCTSCMNMTMRRNGTCLVCATCGTTTGCS